MNETMATQLGDIFNKPTRKVEDKSRKKNMKEKNNFHNLPRPSEWEGDGIDHINVWYNGRTDIGRTLDPNANFKFSHSAFGTFNSVSGFWDFIITGGFEDRFRTFDSGSRRRLRESLSRVEVPYLQFIILDALWQRIRQYPHLKQVIAESTLPFDIYRTSGEFQIPSRVHNNMWIVDGLEYIRKCLQQDKPVNLCKWSEGKSRQDIFDEYHALYLGKRVKEAPKPNMLLATLVESARNKAVPKDTQRKPRPPRMRKDTDQPVTVTNQTGDCAVEIDAEQIVNSMTEEQSQAVESAIVSTIVSTAVRLFDEAQSAEPTPPAPEAETPASDEDNI